MKASRINSMGGSLTLFFLGLRLSSTRLSDKKGEPEYIDLFLKGGEERLFDIEGGLTTPVRGRSASQAILTKGISLSLLGGG